MNNMEKLKIVWECSELLAQEPTLDPQEFQDFVASLGRSKGETREKGEWRWGRRPERKESGGVVGDQRERRVEVG
jgi:hypothetical protein